MKNISKNQAIFGLLYIIVVAGLLVFLTYVGFIEPFRIPLGIIGAILTLGFFLYVRNR